MCTVHNERLWVTSFSLPQASFARKSRCRRRLVKTSLDAIPGESSDSVHFKQNRWSLIPRGGASSGRVYSPRVSATKLATVTIATLAGMWSVYYWVTTPVSDRPMWLALLTDKKLLQSKTVDLLRQFQPPPLALGSTFSLREYVLHYFWRHKGGWYYMLGIMAVAEALGLSTIPIETAAGMIFGWNAMIFSLSGKLLGALTAFLVSRHLLSAQLKRKFLPDASPSAPPRAPPPVWATVLLQDEKDKSSKQSSPFTPWQIAFFFKCSVFPEFVKNVGPALIPSVSYKMLLTTTTVHGGFFTLLWTWWGVMTSASSTGAGAAATVSPLLQGVTAVAMTVGLVGSPILTSYFLNTLRKLHTGSGAGSKKPTIK
jgi:hypothetical protein